VGSTILVAALVISVVANVVLLVLVVGALQAEGVRKHILSGIAAGGGISAARMDFRLGISRLYELSDENAEKFTGRTEGPYEVWARPNNAKIGPFGSDLVKSFVLSYNAEMREIHEHPEMHAADYDYRNAGISRPRGQEGL